MKNLHQLFTFAKKAMENAYAPYSEFKVGAAVLADDGNIYSGCNVENISYPCGTCAEAGAIAAMINGGGKKIRKIVVVADGKELIKPCGACLQRILEFSDETTEILLATPEGIARQTSLAELLPLAFKEF